MNMPIMTIVTSPMSLALIIWKGMMLIITNMIADDYDVDDCDVDADNDHI